MHIYNLKEESEANATHSSIAFQLVTVLFHPTCNQFSKLCGYDALLTSVTKLLIDNWKNLYVLLLLEKKKKSLANTSPLKVCNVLKCRFVVLGGNLGICYPFSSSLPISILTHPFLFYFKDCSTIVLTFSH